MNPKKSLHFSKKMLRHVIFSGLLEFGPVLLFLISFGHVNIYGSTMILMVATILSTIITYNLQKRIPYLALYVATITIIFGSMTIHSHKVKFIQMRDTLYDATCALTLIIGIMINVPFLKLAFDNVVPMTNRAWNRLTHAWTAFFILLAIGNEVVRRVFPLHVWFEFKGWMVMVTTVFGLVSLYLAYEAKEGVTSSK